MKIALHELVKTSKGFKNASSVFQTSGKHTFSDGCFQKNHISFQIGRFLEEPFGIFKTHFEFAKHRNGNTGACKYY
jgi:hypothetical protein